MVKRRLSEDPEDLQLQDECDHEWVEAWIAAADRVAESDVYAVRPVAQERKLVRSKRLK